MWSSRTSTARIKLFWKLWVMMAFPIFWDVMIGAEKQREVEWKLILSSNVKGWNITEFHFGEKNYCRRSMGVWLCPGGKPSAVAGGQREKLYFLSAETFCWERNSTADSVTVAAQVLPIRHSIWRRPWHFRMPNGPTLSFSPAAGLNQQQQRCAAALWRRPTKSHNCFRGCGENK